MTAITFRPAVPEDAAACMTLRALTRENAFTEEDLRALEFERLFLACSSDPNVRSYGFYRHLGWMATGEHDEAGDEILQLRVDTRAR